MKSQKIPAVVKRTAFRVFVLVLTAVMLITSGAVNAQMFDRLQAMYDLAQQTFTLAPEEGVTVELSGMMPKGGSATAVPAETEDEDVIHAYDITIRYQDGREFEPDNDEPISVSFMSDQIAEALKDDETLEVAHIPDNGEEEDVALTSAGGDTATFEAESFSVYLIRTHAGDPLNHNPRRIYHFLSPEFTTTVSNGITYYQAPEYLFPNKLNEMVSVQAIRTGESLQEIVMPENKTNGLFYGWYVVQITGSEDVEVDGAPTTMYTYSWGTGSQERIAFNEPINFPDATDDEDIYLAPVYARYRFLTFHQDTENSGSDNANIIVCRKLIILNDEHKCTLSISDVRAPSPSPNKIVFVGWKYTHTDGDSYNQGTGEGGKIEEHVTVNHEGEEIPTSITIEDTREHSSSEPETSLIYDIWPIFEEARWVEFDSGGNGATYRPAQFILLKDDTTGFNNAPVKSGFTFDGWYYEADNGDRVMVTGPDANIIPGLDKTLTNGMSIVDGKLKMTPEAEESSANRIFRASWTPSAQATFAVIVWKQKVTDSKYAGGEGYPKKTYDFAGYYPNLTGLTTEDPRECDAYKNIDGTGKGFEDFTTTRTTGDGDANFVGFHFYEAVVSDNGYNQPDYKNKINPNNSTVVNVYYDRDLMHITFHYSSAPSGALTDGSYRYVATDGTDGDQYGNVNGEYVLLTTDATFYATSFSFSSKYTASTNNDAVMYGIVGGEYVLLDAAPVFNRTTGYNNYIYTCVGPSSNINSNSPQKYGIRNGQFVEVSYSTWYNNWRYNGSNYTGPLYTTASSTSATYTGKAYTLSGTTFTQTDATNGTLYGIEDADGNFGTSDGKTQGDKVYRVTFANQYNYSYNGVAYTGTRYLKSADNTFYNGKLYQKTENVFEETTDTTIVPLYGTRTEDVYEELTKQDNTTVYTWYTSPTPSDETRYTGTRYIRYTRVSDYNRPYTLEWTGLYGSSFDQNNYVYPIEQRWTEGDGTGQTLVTDFDRVNATGTASLPQYDLYQGTWGNTKVIYHLRQRLDGSYSRDDPDLCTPINIPDNHRNLIIENKFEGFEVCAYGNTFNPAGSGNGVMTVSDGDSINRDIITYIYHRRRSGLELMFNDNFDGGENYIVENLKYGQSIAGYHDVYEPEEREHYTFAGWYEDSAGTQPFDFDTVIYSSKIVYAKWNKERYRIMVDPNGGEMPLGSNTATFFNVDFDELVGQYADLRRNYVEDNNGDYVYANFQYDKVAGAPGLGGSNLAAVYRKAFYINKNEDGGIEGAYNRVFTVDGVQYSYAQSGLNFDEFKSCIDMNRLYARADGTITYELVSWHKVRADGTVETLPFNFKDFVTEDTTIRARWFEHGGYSLAYDATSDGVTGTMVRYNDPMDDRRKYADKASVVVLYEPSNIRTVGQGGHEEEASEYIFRGWRIVDGATQKPLEPGVFYDPGETMVLDASHADHQGVIHMKAYYEKRTATVRRPDSAAVTLNANSATASVNEQGLAGDNKEYADIQNKAVKIERQIHNFKLELKNYIKNFSNTDGSKLLGWNTTATSDSYIPEFYADAEVGVNKQGAANAPYNINTLYAVWEPMVYLTLDNATTQPITFNLDFKEHDNSAYAGYVMAMTGEYDRVPFGEMSTDKITVTDKGSGSYSVTLQPGGKVQLVVPSGVLNEAEPVSYTVSGDYATTNTKDLFIYNSGSASGVSIEKRNNRWYLDGTQTNDNPIHYTNTGKLVKGTQGRLVRFTEDGNSTVKVNLTARYYDLETETWKDATSSSGVNAEMHFQFSSAVTETTSNEGATVSATLVDNSNHSAHFGMKVQSYSSDYKCIGWYTVDEAAPNTISVDGHSSDFGAADIPATTLAIPTEETTYYALFVPYVSGPLEITHSQRNDSAGDSADEGLGLSVQYYTDPDAMIDIASDTGDNESAASVELYKFPNTENVIIDEKNTAGHLVVTVSAKANDYSTYKATYRGQNAVSLSYDEDAECYKASFDETVANHFADSDTVKGLKVLKPINYYSVFSRKFEIIYTYTARDGQAKDYTLKGSLDSFKDFDLYVIRHTPYVRTLAGDTVWDTANMTISEDETGMHAALSEVSAVRAHCSVTINEAGGYTPTVSVPYGETFTEELALNHKAPETNSAGQTFAYWDIKNTDTDKHIAKCYSPKFTFKVWNNYTITPVYQDEPEEITDEGQFITIDYIDTSRNPWGDAVYSEDDDTTDRSAVTDKVVADLDITFINNGKRIYDDLDEDGNNRYQLGVMFEVCGETTDGTFDASAYESDYEGRLSRVTALLANTSATPSSRATINDVNCYYTKINISLNTVSDFNRSEFARSFNAVAVKNYVFRMYAYMVTPEGDTVLSDPYYMTFYGSATPQYALSASGE